MCRSAKLSMWLVLLLIVALTACAPAGTPAPTPTPTREYQQLPMPMTSISGKFDVGGHSLYLECYGEGSPTVVLENGWGMLMAAAWYKIIPNIATTTRVCAYDRASMGISDDHPGLRTSEQMAEQLHTLLGQAGVKGPYILAGHSLGGMNMLVFANRYQGEAAGLVLVDSAHPDQSDRWLAILPTPSPNDSEDLAVLRKDIPWTNPPDSENFREPVNWDETLSQVRAVKSLGSLPLTVLVAVDPAKHDWGAVPSEVAASLDKVWLDLHKEYAKERELINCLI
jgi:pimeloyl-ACP methyl ester carboxylesterase